MSIIIGIDIGGSTTKIVGVRNGRIIAPLMVRANDPVASLFGAFGKFIDQNNLTISDVAKVAITGVGSIGVTKPIYGLPTYKVEEFLSNGNGGLYLSGLDDAVIVSMGTGTAFVRAKSNGEISHLGGTGIGGGTLIGLSNLLLNIRNFDVLAETAAGGNLAAIDLTVADISQGSFANLPPDTTASNFGKLSDIAEKSDIALAIFNLVFQSIGVMAVFAARGIDRTDTVLIGNLSKIPYCRQVFDGLESLYGFKFIIPEYSEYGTAVGAALTLDSGSGYRQI